MITQFSYETHIKLPLSITIENKNYSLINVLEDQILSTEHFPKHFFLGFCININTNTEILLCFSSCVYRYVYFLLQYFWTM